MKTPTPARAAAARVLARALARGVGAAGRPGPVFHFQSRPAAHKAGPRGPISAADVRLIGISVAAGGTGATRCRGRLPTWRGEFEVPAVLSPAGSGPQVPKPH